MGAWSGARSVKLGEHRGARVRAQGVGAIIFVFCWPMLTLFSCCLHQKDIGVQG